MKKIIKVIKKIIFIVGITVVSFLLFIVLWYFLIGKNLDEKEKEPEVTITYDAKNVPQKIDEESIPDTRYCDSLEETLMKENKKTEEEEYQNNIDEVIKKFDNDGYITIYFRSIKDRDTECMTIAKFKKKKIEDREKYVFLFGISTEATSDLVSVGSLESLIKAQLALSDYTQKANIDPEHTRFVYGNCRPKKIYKLKIEGQKPDGVIPYEILGERWYFWYYEDLKSNVVGSKLKFTLE